MSTEKIMGKVNSWESFGAADGPGLRYVIFLQGCHMRCKYCHNPETWSLNGGEEISAEDAFKKVMRYKNYWGSNFDKAKGRITGGITISGGEALLQIDFVTEVFRLAKEQGVHTTLDTSGNPFTFEEPFKSKFDKLMEVTDLFMLDIKEIEDDKHKELTKWTNINILEMAKYLSDNGKEMWIRHVLVPGITDDEEGLKKLKSFVDDLKTVSKVEILPYHTLGLEKWKNLKFDYPLEGVKTPTKEEVKKAEELLGIVK
ncbi:MAG: pyruvate formate lyase-activating protein [Lachnospiraceae bacterium]|nr:pyruvate formate lyase-activating protein [Lachnospiraceae bacterium]